MPKKIARYYNEDVANAYEYNPEKAKELLKKAGYEKGFELVIQVPSSYSQHVATAEIIVEDLKAVGIKATLKKIFELIRLHPDWSDKDVAVAILGQ